MCPDCRAVDCYPELSQEDCPEGTILKEGLAFGGCCPACVTYMGEGEIIHILQYTSVSTFEVIKGECLLFNPETGELCQPNSPNIGAETIFSKYLPIPCTLYSGTNSESGWGQEWAFSNESLVKSGDRWIPLIRLFDCHPNYSCRSGICTVTYDAKFMRNVEKRLSKLRVFIKT